MRKFLKMHGLGNDFVIFDFRDGTKLSKNAAKEISDRRTGIGCDQILILKNSSKKADIAIEIRNSDGSVAKACGNGSRCVAELILYETGKKEIVIETIDGLLKAWKNEKDSKINIDMGKPEFRWEKIPLNKKMDHKSIDLGSYAPSKAFCLSMGNPHAVFFVDEIEKYKLNEFGPLLETHEIFPDKANISIAKVLTENKIRMRIWERGAGITRACGSGACAVVVAAYELKKINTTCDVILDGGKLTIWIETTGNVILSGPTETSFEGLVNTRLSKLISN